MSQKCVFLQAISNFVPVVLIQNRSLRFETTDFPVKWKEDASENPAVCTKLVAILHAILHLTLPELSAHPAQPHPHPCNRLQWGGKAVTRLLSG